MKLILQVELQAWGMGNDRREAEDEAWFFRLVEQALRCLWGFQNGAETSAINIGKGRLAETPLKTKHKTLSPHTLASKSPSYKGVIGISVGPERNLRRRTIGGSMVAG